LANLSVALRHPSLITGFLRGDSSIDLIRKLIEIEARRIERILEQEIDDPGGDNEFDRVDEFLGFLSGTVSRREPFFEPAPSLLYALCRLRKPQVVFETGVEFGVSTTFLLLALEANSRGNLYSIDFPEAEYWAPESTYAPGRHVRHVLPAGFSTGALVPDRLRHRWNLSIGRSQDLLAPLLRDWGPTDLFFRDSEHTYEAMMFEFETAWKFMRQGGFLVSDNVDRNRSFRDFCESKGAPFWLIEYVGVAQKV